MVCSIQHVRLQRLAGLLNFCTKQVQQIFFLGSAYRLYKSGGWSCLSCLHSAKPGLEAIQLFICSTQLTCSMKIHLLIKTKIMQNNDFSCFQTLRCCIMLINVGIFTFMSMIHVNLVHSLVEHEKSFISSGPGLSTVFTSNFRY